jgi:hypothetical protein
MSATAGNILFRGWTGDVTKGEPAFIEMAPRLEQRPGSGVELIGGVRGIAGATVTRFIEEMINTLYVQQKLNRTIICPTKNTQVVTSELPTSDATISINLVSENGATESRGYGSGWRLLNFDETTFAPGFSRITAVYQRVINPDFELILPLGFTVTCENGVGSFNWAGQPLEQFDSGTGVCSSGFKVEIGETSQNGQRFLERNDPFESPRQVQTPGYFLVVNGVSFEEFYPKLPEIQRDYYEFRGGPFLTESEAREAAEEGQDVLLSGWTLVYNKNFPAPQTNTKEEIGQLFRTRALSPVPRRFFGGARDLSVVIVKLWGVYETKTDFFVSGGSGSEAVNSDGLPLDLKSLRVKWVVENNKIKLKVGDSVWKQYELPEDDS